MKTTSLYSYGILKKMMLAFTLALASLAAYAQTTCVVSGITITNSGTSGANYYTPTFSGNGGCSTTAFTGLGAWSGGSAGQTLNYNFSVPVTSVRVAYSSVNGGSSPDIGDISVNNTGTVTLSNPCNFTVSGTQITGVASGFTCTDSWITVTSTKAFTTLTYTVLAGTTGNGAVQGNPCTFQILATCAAGSTAPTLNGTTISNACPATTVNLNTKVSGTAPGGTSLVWFTNNTHTGTAVADPTAVATSGTYYAFYYDATSDCYGPVSSSAVTATVNGCPLTCTSSGITITASGSSNDTYYTPASNGACPTSSFTGTGIWTGSGIGGNLVYTFSSQVTSVRVAYTGVNGSSTPDIGNITVNGGGTVVLSNPCNFNVSGTQVTGTSSGSNNTDCWITVTSSLPFSTLTYTVASGTTGFGVVQGNLCTFQILAACNAGSTAPTLNGTTISNTCPALAVNLNSKVSSTAPTGTSLVWFTNSTHTGTAVTTPTAVTTSGTYYAFYYDATNNCYSPGSSAVTATVTSCPTACNVSGITITSTGISNAVYNAPSSNGSCPTSSFTGLGWWSGNAAGGTITYTFSAPVASVRVPYSSVDGSSSNPDQGYITVNGGGTATLSNPCNFIVSGNQVTASVSSGYTDSWITVSSTAPFTTLTFTNNGSISGLVQGNLCSIQILSLVSCNAGATAPVVY